MSENEPTKPQEEPIIDLKFYADGRMQLLAKLPHKEISKALSNIATEILYNDLSSKISKKDNQRIVVPDLNITH